MPASQIAILGAFAGLTIFLGLPLGRVRAEIAALIEGVKLGEFDDLLVGAAF